jgi:hypothetical protein
MEKCWRLGIYLSCHWPYLRCQNLNGSFRNMYQEGINMDEARVAMLKCNKIISFCFKAEIVCRKLLHGVDLMI